MRVESLPTLRNSLSVAVRLRDEERSWSDENFEVRLWSEPMVREFHPCGLKAEFQYLLS